MKKFWLGLGLALGLAFVTSQGLAIQSMMTRYTGLVLSPRASGQTYSLQIQNSSGTDIFTVATAGAITAQGTMTMDNGEYWTNATDDLMSAYGGGGSDNTDITVDLDGTYPILYSITDTKVGFNDIITGQSGDSLSNAAADVWTIDCAGACTAAANLSIDTDETGGVPALSSSTATKIRINETLVGTNGDTLDNSAADSWVFGCGGACTNAVDLTVDTDSSVGAAGPVVLSSTSSTVVEVAETLDVSAAGGLVLSNDETITNAVNGEVLVTATAFQASGSIEAQGGNVILQSGDTISNAVADSIVLGCAGACTNAVDLTVDTDSSVGAAGPVVLSSASSTVIECAETFDISAAGGLVLSNDETITNAVNGEVLVTATAFQASGSIEAQGGDIILQSADKITNAAADVVKIECAGACTNVADLTIDTDSGTAAGPPELSSTSSTRIKINDILALENGETINNTTTDDMVVISGNSGTNDVDLTVDLDAAAPAGPVVLSSGTSTVIECAETFDISAAGGLVLSNDETITNAVNGEVLVTATAFQSSGSIEAQGGNVILQSGDTISNAVADAIVLGCAGACTNAVDLTVDTDSSVGAAGPVVLSSTSSTVIECAETFDISAAGGLVLSNDEILANAADDTVTLTGGAGTNNLAISWDLDGAAADSPVEIASSTSTVIQFNEIIGVGTNGETIDGVTTDDMVVISGVGGSNNVDFSIDVDAAAGAGPPRLFSTSSTQIQVDEALDVTGALTAPGGATITCTDCITETNVADTTYPIVTPLYVWRTSAGAAPLPVTAATTPNTATEGNWETYEWLSGEQASKIETTIIVPSNYVSGLSLVATVTNDAAAANNAETMSVTWYESCDGDADNEAVIDEGIIAITNDELMQKETIPLDGPAAADVHVANCNLRVIVGFTAIDQTMHIAGLGFTFVGK